MMVITVFGDEAHVVANRALYREKFARVVPLLRGVHAMALVLVKITHS